MVGTELSKLIPEWAVSNSKKCKCRDFAAKMDRWGVEGCIARKDQIVAHLIAQDDHLIPMLKMIPDSVKRVAACRILGKAIRNAQA
jgi:hypothetical protein